MRTQDEIVAKVTKLEGSGDFFGFQRNDMIAYLDFEHAKPYLKEEATADQWEVTEQSPKDQAIDYMPFAWEKANNCRGLSAGRSINHFQAWLWLDGADEAWVESLSDYEYYGKNKLIEVCKYLGLDAAQWDDGVRTNTDD